MAEVQFEGRIDRKLYVEAQRLYMRPGRRAIALMVLAISMIGYGVIGVPFLQGSPPSVGIIAGVPAVAALWLVFLWFLSPIVNAWRVERTSRMFGCPLRGVATEDGIDLESPFGTAKLPWGVFFRFKMTTALVIVYQSAHMFNVYPRSFFGSDEDWRIFRSWVTDKVPASPRKRPGSSAPGGGGEA
jgi:YcxB-like protein